jgi:hypothetical protein
MAEYESQNAYEFGSEVCRMGRLNFPPLGSKGRVGKLYNPTPMMLAVLSGNIDMLAMVLEQFAGRYRPGWGCQDLTKECAQAIRTKKGNTLYFHLSSLDLAAYYGRLDMVQLLIRSGAPANWLWQWEWRCQALGPSVLTGICDWGFDLHISEQQRSGRVAVLNYLLDEGHPVNKKDDSPFKLGEGRLPKRGPLPNRFTPLWFTIWAMKPEHLELAQVLVRRGAKWAPWTKWRAAPWLRQRIYKPFWQEDWRLSPLEWVLRGGECRYYMYTLDGNGTEATNEDDEIIPIMNGPGTHEPNKEQLKVEEAVFMTMMEEGKERPTTSYRLRWAMELVLYAYTKRASNRHPLLVLHFMRMVAYLQQKGATMARVHENSTKAYAALVRRSQKLAEADETATGGS